MVEMFEALSTELTSIGESLLFSDCGAVRAIDRKSGLGVRKL
jgi:hypothetical protein